MSFFDICTVWDTTRKIPDIAKIFTQSEFACWLEAQGFTVRFYLYSLLSIGIAERTLRTMKKAAKALNAYLRSSFHSILQRILLTNTNTHTHTEHPTLTDILYTLKLAKQCSPSLKLKNLQSLRPILFDLFEREPTSLRYNCKRKSIGTRWYIADYYISFTWSQSLNFASNSISAVVFMCNDRRPNQGKPTRLQFGANSRFLTLPRLRIKNNIIKKETQTQVLAQGHCNSINLLYSEETSHRA